MYLSMPNAVINDALPSRIRAGMHEILGCFDVNGLATEASVSLKLTPACAAFNAPQSLALFQRKREFRIFNQNSKAANVVELTHRHTCQRSNRLIAEAQSIVVSVLVTFWRILYHESKSALENSLEIHLL